MAVILVLFVSCSYGGETHRPAMCSYDKEDDGLRMDIQARAHKEVESHRGLMTSVYYLERPTTAQNTRVSVPQIPVRSQVGTHEICENRELHDQVFRNSGDPRSSTLRTAG